MRLLMMFTPGSWGQTFDPPPQTLDPLPPACSQTSCGVDTVRLMYARIVIALLIQKANLWAHAPQSIGAR